jgi:hypothetical protein
MPKRMFSADLPLVCGRVFEPSRLQDHCWLEAYQHLVPGRTCGKATRTPTAAGSAGKCPRKKAANRAPKGAHHPGGLCA